MMSSEGKNVVDVNSKRASVNCIVSKRAITGKSDLLFVHGRFQKRPVLMIEKSVLQEAAKIAISQTGKVYIANAYDTLNDIERALIRSVERETGVEFVFSCNEVDS